ncbi:MAG TPA: MoaD/ThiS family protein [Gaiellaceae bacterium]|nr:MoaD/ThiS family protein [Gaiellaceae bacterium]
MSVIRIPPTLRAQTGGEREVIVEGETVRDLLDDLTSRFPGLNGQLEYANVYVGGEDIRTRDGYETPVSESDTVILLPAMAGGSTAENAAHFPRA